jgi:hypothetical protein
MEGIVEKIQKYIQQQFKTNLNFNSFFFKLGLIKSYQTESPILESLLRKQCCT